MLARVHEYYARYKSRRQHQRQRRLRLRLRLRNIHINCCNVIFGPIVFGIQLGRWWSVSGVQANKRRALCVLQTTPLCHVAILQKEFQQCRRFYNTLGAWATTTATATTVAEKNQKNNFKLFFSQRICKCVFGVGGNETWLFSGWIWDLSKARDNADKASRRLVIFIILHLRLGAEQLTSRTREYFLVSCCLRFSTWKRKTWI